MSIIYIFLVITVKILYLSLISFYKCYALVAPYVAGLSEISPTPFSLISGFLSLVSELEVDVMRFVLPLKIRNPRTQIICLKK